jgi:hypothetical protein
LPGPTGSISPLNDPAHSDDLVERTIFDRILKLGPATDTGCQDKFIRVLTVGRLRPGENCRPVRRPRHEGKEPYAIVDIDQ